VSKKTPKPKRVRSECPTCQGTRKVADWDPEGKPWQRDCATCRGTGAIWTGG
jgi:DnaJ-class molecular chaperone